MAATGDYTPPYTMIGGGSYGNRFYTGDIGEVLVYNTVLTTAQRQEVEQYLTANGSKPQGIGEVWAPAR